MGLAAATVAEAGIGAATSLIGSSEQAGAANHATDVQQHMFDTTQANLKPYMTAGSNSLGQLMNLLGLGPNGQSGIQSALTSTPGYNFQFNQGEQALLDAKSATGGVRGGNTLKALTAYGQGMGQTEYQQALANYGSVASLGENAAANLGNTSASVGANIGNSIMAGGNAASAGLVGAGNAINSGMSNYLLYSMMNNGGGAGGIGAGGYVAPGGEFG